MTTALFVLTIVCVAADAAIAVADLARARFVMANSARVGLAAPMVPYLAVLKLAGAIGLALGLLGVRWLGLAGGAGLTLFFLGAIGAHVRARVFDNLVFPVGYLLLAVAATTYFMASG